jgi:ribosome-associated protein YbcJ (S4-like RNA binding protein)
MAGFLDNLGKINPNISRILKTISGLGSFGMEYKDMVIEDSMAIGVSEANMRERFGFTESDEDFIYSIAAQDTSNRKYIAYFDKDYPFKRDFLRTFALNSEIEYILDTICDEAVVYDEKNFFCHPALMSMDLKDDVVKSMRSNFRKLYVLHNFANGLTAWQYFRQLIVEGFLAFEIIYSNDGKEIVGFKELDAVSLTPAVERKPDGTRETIWWQYYGETTRQRKLLDAQVIYISYAKANVVSRVSYTERLIRSYNLLKIMEHSRIIWNVMNAQYRIKMTVPIGSKAPQKAKETLGELMSVYKEDIKLDTTSGELSINGRPDIQFYKNYLFPQQGGESVKIETLNAQGPNLNIMDSVVYFYNKLRQDSKIPYNRFSSRFGVGSNNVFKTAADGAERDEVRFAKFITRLRSIFQEIIVKPLWIQMCLEFPELKNDAEFRSQIGVKFESDNMFGESREIEQLIKKIDFITAMGEIKETVKEEEVQYFDQDFMIERWLDLNYEDIQLNKSYIRKAEEEGKSGATGATGATGAEAGGAEAGAATGAEGEGATGAAV